MSSRAYACLPALHFAHRASGSARRTDRSRAFHTIRRTR